MKKLASILVTSLTLAVSGVANAGDRNLSGAWENGSDTWVIAHMGNHASFSTSEYHDEIGLVSMNFSGFVSSDEDRFSYRGTGETIRIRVDDLVCYLDPSMRARGYVSGELGGRIIHMRSCTVSISTRCVQDDTGRSFRKSFDADCSGTWR